MSCLAIVVHQSASSPTLIQTSLYGPCVTTVIVGTQVLTGDPQQSDRQVPGDNGLVDLLRRLASNRSHHVEVITQAFQKTADAVCAIRTKCSACQTADQVDM
jgi:hypothetical protein